ncbi:MAG: hypothetical protein Q9219_003373 [cf. Caloplaca sp. 3 TL-2023]
MPRKSNVSQGPATGEENTPAKEKDGVNIERLAKGVLPPNTQIQKDAITAISKGATVFVNHIADKANEITLSTSRKTISPNAVLEALAECEFADFLPRVEAELKRFNEIATGKRNEYRRKVKEKEMGGVSNDAPNSGAAPEDANEQGETGGEEDEGGERATKRMRREEGGEKKARQQQRVSDDAEMVQSEGDTRDESAMVDETEQDQGAEDDYSGQENEDGEEEDEVSDEEADREDDGDAGSGSGPDMDARLRAIQDGLSSGVEDGSSEGESD